MRSNDIVQIPNLVSELRFYRRFVRENNVYGLNFLSSNNPLCIFFNQIGLASVVNTDHISAFRLGEEG